MSVSTCRTAVINSVARQSGIYNVRQQGAKGIQRLSLASGAPSAAQFHAGRHGKRYEPTLSSRRIRPIESVQRGACTIPRRKSWSVRQANTVAPQQRQYEAVVVGAGPAGITVVGNLLEQRVEPILWVDESFTGGRINQCYREVPSNTKVGLFVDFATAVAPFRKIVSNIPSRSRWEEPRASDGEAVDGVGQDKLAALKSLPQDEGCKLAYAADMTLMLTEGLMGTPGVDAEQARVSEAVLDEASSMWTVRVDGIENSGQPSQVVQAKKLILCTGSSPDNSPLPVDIPNIQALDLDCALSPTTLMKTLSTRGPTTIAVVGASHSAILVLMNLYHLASSTKSDLRVKWFTRHPLRYAEYMDGWILRDNTGLKGEAATWAKANLEPDTLPNSDVSKYVTKVGYNAGEEKAIFKQYMDDCDFYVQAIGFSRQPIPDLRTSTGKAIAPIFDHETGTFTHSTAKGAEEKDRRLPGMFAAGIAWPERVRDPLGNVEYAVGFFKFMKFVKRVVPRWVSS